MPPAAVCRRAARCRQAVDAAGRFRCELTPAAAVAPPAAPCLPAAAFPRRLHASGRVGAASPPPPAVLGSYLTIDPAMKSLFDKIEKPDQPVLFSIVLSAKDPLLDELDRYGKDHSTALQIAKSFKLDDPSVRRRSE